MTEPALSVDRGSLAHDAGVARLGVLVSGGGSNMDAIAAACEPGGVLAGLARVALVVSNKPGVLALERAERRNLPSVVLPHGGHPTRLGHERAVIAALRGAGATHVILAGWMRIWTGDGLAELALPVLNIHPVPTYWYQGPRGYEHLFAEAAAGRVECAFATVHLVDAGVDTGDVVLYGEPYPTPKGATLDQLRDAGLRHEHALFPLAIRHFLRKNRDLPRSQGNSPAPGEVLTEAEARAAAFTALVKASLAARAAGLAAEARVDGLAIPHEIATLSTP